MSLPEDSLTPRLRADAARNRDQILVAARDALAEGELPGFNELARRARVGVGTVYRHFADESAVLLGVAEYAVGDLLTSLERAGELPDPEARFDAAFVALLTRVRSNPALQAVLQDPRQAGSLAEVERAAEGLREAAVGAGIIDARVTLDDIRRLVCGVAHAAAAGGDQADAAIRYAHVVLRGLRPAG